MLESTRAALLADIQADAALVEALTEGRFGDIVDAYATIAGTREVHVPWADIFRHLDTVTCPEGPFFTAPEARGLPVRYVLANYRALGGTDNAVAVACWMGVENWTHPAYPTVDVHHAAFVGFCETLIAADIIAQAQLDTFTAMGTVPATRAELLFGARAVVTIDDVMASRPRVKPPRPELPAAPGAAPSSNASPEERSAWDDAERAYREGTLALEAYRAEWGES